MDSHHEIVVQLPGDATIEIIVPPEPPPAAFDPFGHGSPFDPPEPDLVPFVRGKIRRLDVVYTQKFVEADDGVQVPVAGWRQVSLEQELLAGSDTRLRLRELLESLRERVEIQDSNRPDWSNFALAAGEDETDGTGLFVAFTNQHTSETRQFALTGHSETWQRQIPPPDRLTRLETDAGLLPNEVDRARFDQAIAAARAQVFENWTSELAGRYHSAGTIQAALAPGRWIPSWTSERHFNECDPLADGFVTRVAANIYSDAADPGIVAIGFDLACEIEIWVTPQLHNLLVSWIDVYEWHSLFSSGLLFFAQQRQWRQPLPWAPRPYRVSAIGTDGNDDAMSEMIKLTNGYAAMIRAGNALEVQGSLYGLALVMRVNGKWNLFRGRYYAGELAGIIRANHGPGGVDAPGTEIFIFNTINRNMVPVAFDEGKLWTDQVLPDFGFLIPSHLGFRP